MNVAVLDKQTVLDPVRHHRLIDDLEHIASIAGINPLHIKRSMLPFCDSDEIDYVTNFRLYRESVPGLLLIGKEDVDDRCSAMCGAFVRNFIDARVITLTTLLDATDSGHMPDPSVLIVPNFYLSSYGKTLPAWKIASIYDILLQRAAEGRPTILAMDNYKAMQQSYGLSITNQLKKFKGQ